LVTLLGDNVVVTDGMLSCQWRMRPPAMDQLLGTPTPRRYLQWRITPLMEEQLLFVMEKARATHVLRC